MVRAVFKKTCKLCAYFSPELCGYVKLQGAKDKGGNTRQINLDMLHNCPDFKYREGE